MVYQNGQLRDDVADKYGPDVYVEFLSDFMQRNSVHRFLPTTPWRFDDVTDDLQHPVPYKPGKDRYDSYAEMVTAMDDRVGKIVKAVEDLGLRDGTMIVFLGDNGTAAQSIIRAENGKYIREPVYSETSWGRMQGGKASLSDAGTRVPWIVSWPGRVTQGVSTGTLVDASDLLPTLLDLADVPVPQNLQLDGAALPELLLTALAPRDWVYAEHQGQSWVGDRRWKLYDDGRLFDRHADPLEKQALPEPFDTDAARHEYGWSLLPDRCKIKSNVPRPAAVTQSITGNRLKQRRR